MQEHFGPLDIVKLRMLEKIGRTFEIHTFPLSSPSSSSSITALKSARFLDFRAQFADERSGDVPQRDATEPLVEQQFSAA